MSRIHLSRNDLGEAAFSNPTPNSKGVDGDIKRKSFFGQSIEVIGKDEQGTLTTEKLNKGSLIDFLNTQLSDAEKLKKGWFFHASDDKVQAAYAKVFSQNQPSSNSPSNQNTFSAISSESTQSIQTAPLENEVTISICLIDDNELDIYIDPNKTVEEFKEKLCKKTNDKSHLKNELIYNSQVLEDDRTLKSYNIEDLIYQRPYDRPRKPNLNPGKALSFDQVIESANDEFSDHPQKDIILEILKQRLKSIGYQSSVKNGEAPYLDRGNSPSYSGHDTFIEHYGTEEEKAKLALKYIIRRFLFNLPGVDTQEGHILK